LVIDVVISSGIQSGPGTDPKTQQFPGVVSTNPTELPQGYNSSHMKKNIPAGGTILFMDTHVEWRDFRAMAMWGSGATATTIGFSRITTRKRGVSFFRRAKMSANAMEEFVRSGG
jgi:hypothetical protein